MFKKILKSEGGRGGLLSALRPKRERGIRIEPKKSTVIGVFSCKGGVGKTTTVANIGMYLSERMKNNILAVDANLTAPNLNLHLGEFNPKVTIHDALADELPIQQAILEYHGLPVLLGSIAYGEQIHLVDLRGQLEPLKEKYKLILIDSAPGIGSEVVAAIKACDEIIIVTNPTIPTIASTLRTFRAAEQHKVPVMGIVVNMVRKEPFELPIGDVRKAMGWPILAVVPEDRKVRESTAAGIPVVRYYPKSPAAKEFGKLGESLIERITKG